MMTENGAKRRRGVGRPRSDSAQAHAAIMDAAHNLLQRTSVRDLTIEAIAKEAGVGKATLYKWWPSKTALVFAMFHERLAYNDVELPHATPEAAIRARALRLISELDGLFGKVVMELIAEAQSESSFLNEFYQGYVRERRVEGITWIEQAQAEGMLRDGVSAELVIDQIFGAIYYRRLLGIQPLDQEYGNRLVDQVFAAVRR